MDTTIPKGAAGRLKRCAAVVGIGITDWVADWTRTRAGEKPANSYGYAMLALNRALRDAGLTRDDLDGIIVGPHLGYQQAAETFGLNPRWGDQGDAASAVMKACMAIESGMATTIALVFGYDQRSRGVAYGDSRGQIRDSHDHETYHASWGLTSPGALYALQFQAYKHARGFSEADLGEVAVAQRGWSHLNANAIMRKKISIDDYMGAPYVCEPLRLYDYCLINDGGVALIVTDRDRAAASASPVFIEAIGRRDLNRTATSFEPRLVDFYLSGQQAVAAEVFDMAGVGPEDIDAAQIYDSFSVHIPLALEGYGYCRIGEASAFLKQKGIGPGGRLPVNTHGGHLSESYMQGWGHQVECVRQIRGRQGARQVADCRYVHYSSDVQGRCCSIIYSR